MFFDTPMIMHRTITPAINETKIFEGPSSTNDAEYGRKLWTYEENRKFLEASQKFGLDYKKIQAYIRTRSV